ncbi:hypothetical protein [Limnohabitans sp. MORI2]|uniref:hypothetical protein n=1 Tax=Limnohabitans sp. MORI2 TaxID=1751150 RepID=UPI0024928BFB|nr:hypothetical protein [Limnohabitans sp. MORI2]
MYPLYNLINSQKKIIIFNINRIDVALILFSLIFASIFGVGYFGFQTGDHDKNQMIFKELIVRDWPVIFPENQVNNQILSYPIGFFIFPALVGKKFGWLLGNIFLFLSHATGIALVLLWIIRLLKSKMAILFFILFGGFDIIGELVFNRFQFSLGTHIEWWTSHTFLQYSSFATVLSWSAQHFSAQFLGVCIIYYLIQARMFRYLLYVISLIAFWSHFTLIGYAIFAPLLFKNRRIKDVIFTFNSFAIIFICVLAIFYLSKDQSSIPRGFLWSYWDFNLYGQKFIAFYLLEFLILSLFLFFHKSILSKEDFILLVSATLMLAILPFYKIGWSNDFSMRGSGPPLFIIYLISMKQLQIFIGSGKKISSSILLLILLIGSFSGLSELYRQVNLSFKENKFYILNITSGDYHRGLSNDNKCILIKNNNEDELKNIAFIVIQGRDYNFDKIVPGLSQHNLSLCVKDRINIRFPDVDVYRIDVMLFNKNDKEILGTRSILNFREIDDVNSISSRWPEQYTGDGDSKFAKYLMRKNNVD